MIAGPAKATSARGSKFPIDVGCEYSIIIVAQWDIKSLS